MPDRDRVIHAGDSIVIIPEKSVDEIFVMSLCLVAAIPILLGKAPAPGSVEALLKPWMIFLWSVILAIGAATILLSFLIEDRVLGISIEQVGSACLGTTGLLYAGAIFVSSYNKGGAIPAALVLGFALARIVKFRRNRRTLKKMRKVLAIIEASKEG